MRRIFATRRKLTQGLALQAALEADPLPVKMATAACVIGAGDATAQLIENERKKLPDAARVAREIEAACDAPDGFRDDLPGLIPHHPQPTPVGFFEGRTNQC